MNRSSRRLIFCALSSIMAVLGVSCQSETKAPSSQPAQSPPAQSAAAPAQVQGEGTTTVMFTPGEAGGMVQDTFTASATVSAIDAASRQSTLTRDDGPAVTVTAGPEAIDRVTRDVDHTAVPLVSHDAVSCGCNHCSS